MGRVLPFLFLQNIRRPLVTSEQIAPPTRLNKGLQRLNPSNETEGLIVSKDKDGINQIVSNPPRTLLNFEPVNQKVRSRRIEAFIERLAESDLPFTLVLRLVA